MATSSSAQHQYLIVETLSASNLPDVRLVFHTKPYVTVTGPVMEQHTTNVDRIGKCNPTWNTPFTISLQPTAPADTTLEFSVYIKRRARGRKLLGKADVPVADFEGSDHGARTREYTIDCTPVDISNASRAILRIAAHLSSSPSTSGASRNHTRSSAFKESVKAGAGRVFGGALATDIIGSISAVAAGIIGPSSDENDSDDADYNSNDDYNEN